MAVSPKPSASSASRVKDHRRRQVNPARRAALDFAAELAKLADKAPDAMARSDLFRVIHRTRLRFSKSIDAAQDAVTKAIGLHQANTVREIVEDTGLSPDQVRNTLDGMLALGLAVKRSRGGPRNRGQMGTVFLYYLASVTPSPQ